VTSSGRDELNEFLEKPLEITGGQLSTQVNLSATSLSSGGIDGLLLIRSNGSLVVNDGSNNRVVVGKFSFK
jgi:hypothetical protein